MSLSSEAQALFDHARRSLPRWLTRGKSTALEWLYAFATIMETSFIQGKSWMDITYLENATGSALDQHALDRGTTRRYGEDDISLRERLRNITDTVTIPALKTAIDAILASDSLGECGIFGLRSNRAHCQLPGDSTAFCSRGYRMGNINRPMAYIVILPYGTSNAIGEAITELCRQLGPAGYIAYVEIRQSP